MADTFRIDPAVVWTGDDHDVAVRLAAAQVIGRIRKDMIEKARRG